jgi:hypothetical protein
VLQQKSAVGKPRGDLSHSRTKTLARGAQQQGRNNCPDTRRVHRKACIGAVTHRLEVVRVSKTQRTTPRRRSMGSHAWRWFSMALKKATSSTSRFA